jgi:hypothetical protein
MSGYGWSRQGSVPGEDSLGTLPRNQRVDVSVQSIRERQTYYGALAYLTKSFCVHEYERGNEDHIIAFVRYLQDLAAPETRFVIV